MIVAVISNRVASPDDRSRLLSALLNLETRSRTEPGVIEYRISTDPRDSSVIHGLEIYESLGALRSHLDLPSTRAVMTATGDLHAQLEVTAYEGDLELLDLHRVLGRP